MCEVLGVSRSGYYAFRKRLPNHRQVANVRLVEQIRQIHKASHGRYGSPRIHRRLRELGIACSIHRVERLMARAGLVGIARKRFRVTTKHGKGAIASPDLLQRNFTVEEPHQVWVSDITYVWTDEGWLYLCVILDLYSRTAVGWATSAHINAELVCAALDRALFQYWPLNYLIFHSDRGSQYTSHRFRDMLASQSFPIYQSNGRSCFDNAVTESFFHTLKTELICFEHYRTRGEAHYNIFRYIEGFYNHHRLHSALDYQTPRQKLELSLKRVA
jgi:putative transposase